jgi:Malectin domain
MRFWAFLLALPLAAASTTIDCGSASDSGFTGGIAYTITGSTLPDTTIRYSNAPPFSYRFVVTGPTQVSLRFATVPQAAGATVFSVSINNQVVVDHIDLVSEGGITSIVERNVIVAPDGAGVLKIVFTPIVRAAVIASIMLTPLQDLLPTSGTTTGGLPVYDEFLIPDGGQTSFTTSTAPLGGIIDEVSRNGLLLQRSEFTVSGSGLITVTIPTAQPTDRITVHYRT